MPKQKLPIPFQQFTQLFPEAHAAYERLGGACHTAGPLEAKTRELIQLGMAIGIRSEGAVHAHVRKALEAGASPEEIRHAVLLGIPTLGWPATVAAFTWIGDILKSGPRSRVKKRV
ncbi:MAG: carboxymuconolactone decarboxylase family protein [Candidatus Methylomirabilota bacterium]|nr:carboxymuconolactone decarboxylase family protein [candidate division NC10 bacterium]PWB47988.1 MAG: carboxymuconolactone decarboxylase family protein [candidate division NC10 bacterium]